MATILLKSNVAISELRHQCVGPKQWLALLDYLETHFVRHFDIVARNCG